MKDEDEEIHLTEEETCLVYIFPWTAIIEVRKIKMLMEGREVVVEHVLREGNKVADFLANYVFSFAGSQE